jgi:hypothetical protein
VADAGTFASVEEAVAFAAGRAIAAMATDSSIHRLTSRHVESLADALQVARGALVP